MAWRVPSIALRQARQVLWVYVSVVLLAACNRQQPVAALPYYHTPDFTPHWLPNTPTATDTLHAVTPFSFTNQSGETVSERTVAGKLYVANFFFTQCAGICPTMMNNLKTAVTFFEGDSTVLFLSHTVTPFTDSVPRLKQYAAEMGINSPQWHLLTGNKTAIYQMARRAYFAEEEPGFNKDSSDFLHTEHLLLMDKHRHIRGIYNGTLRLETERLVEDIKLLKQEN